MEYQHAAIKKQISPGLPSFLVILSTSLPNMAHGSIHCRASRVSDTVISSSVQNGSPQKERAISFSQLTFIWRRMWEGEGESGIFFPAGVLIGRGERGGPEAEQ